MTDRSVNRLWVTLGSHDRTVSYRCRVTHPTRDALLDAGEVVAEEFGLAGMSVNRVVANAGVAKGTFYVHFDDRRSFVDALHARFHERVDAATIGAIAGLEPGAELIARSAEAYLDVSLANRAVKALALEARSDPAFTEAMLRRQRRTAVAAIPSFKQMDWPDAEAAARLFLAMTSEVAVQEMQAGRRVPAARRALLRFLHG